MKNLQRGIIVAFEGIDGSGKTTLAHALAERLRQDDLPVVLTKEPGATPLGTELRVLLQSKKHPINPIAESFLFAADRAQHVAQVIKPALEQHALVLCDRMADSSRAYQGFGRGVDRTLLESLIKLALDGVAPDLILYLAIDIETALKRICHRAELSRFEERGRHFYEAVIEGFESIFKHNPRVQRLDAKKEPEVLLDEAYAYLMAWLGQEKIL